MKKFTQTTSDDTSSFAVRRKSSTAVTSAAEPSTDVLDRPPSLSSEGRRHTTSSSTLAAWANGGQAETSASYVETYHPALYGWSYPASLDYVTYGSTASTAKVANGTEAGTLSTNSAFTTENASDSCFSTDYAYKNLLYNSRSSLKSHYYNSAVYSGKYFPAYQASGALYQTSNGQTYSVDPTQTYNRSLKASPYSSLSAYFGGSGIVTASPYYNTSVYNGSGLSGCGNDGHFGTSWYGTPPSVHYYAANACSSTTNGYRLPPLTAGTTIVDDAAVTGEQLSPFLKAEVKKGKSKKRKQVTLSPAPENTFDRVFIWDLEEICILYQSLLNGTFASKYNKDLALSSALGARIEEMILNLSDSYFFFNELEDYDQVHIDDATADELTPELTDYGISSDTFQVNTNGATLCLAPSVRNGVDWVRKLALRYRRIREIYEMYRTNVGGLLGSTKVEQWLELRNEIEKFTNSWQTVVTKCLSLISSRFTQGLRSANILVTNTQLVPALSELLLYNMAHFFPIESVYSAAKIGKESCFERIMTRFGKKCTYVVVGDGRDEEVAAKQMQLPFWRVASHTDLTALHHALELSHL